MSTPSELSQWVKTEAIVIIKAAPQIGARHGETVCCAAVDLEGNWLRLYPVSFRSLEDGRKFGRWDRIRFLWRLPNDDTRIESRRVDQQSIEIVGALGKNWRPRFLSELLVTSLNKEFEAGRSLALLRPTNPIFKIEKKELAEIAKEQTQIDGFHAQKDLFNSSPIIPRVPFPYKFKYVYQTDDGEREGTCQDWETETTFFNWRKHYGETRALADMKRVFGEEFPANGMVLARGTHSRHRKTWLINGVIRLDLEAAQQALDQGKLF